MITVRPMKSGEGAALLSMVRALAQSHNLMHTVLATPEMYEAAMFSDSPIVGTLMAEYDGKLAGCAVWHRSFSTNRGAEVMYLEDLSVLPEFRRRGIARALLKAIARLALEKNYPSVYWLMMDWNTEAKSLYASVGAEIEPGTTFCRIRDDALRTLAS
ncbi:MAG TPA: GNAT family N-acetyltransferase [Aestuariivirga sp.]|jgi:GNAT superfamily N-acetyltransferase|nr:GNAT family N-acetyltransferase [Aestuariivirga sp.]